MSREMDLGMLKIRLKMDQVDESVRALVDVSNEMDKTVDAANGLAGAVDEMGTSFDETSAMGQAMGKALTEEFKGVSISLEDISSGLQKASQALMAVADIVESSSKAIETYGEQWGMTAEQIERITGALDELQAPLMIGAQALMGFSDAMQIATAVHDHLKLSLLTNPITLALMAIAAAVTLLFFAWKENWGGMRDTFDRIWTHMQPLFDAIKRVLSKLGIDVGGLGEIWDKVWRNIGWVLEHFLIPIIDSLIVLVEWIEKAIDAWNEFWGTQQSKPIGAGSYAGGAGGTSPTYTSSYASQTTTVYGGVNVYGTEGTPEAGMTAFEIYKASRTGVK